MYHLHLIEHYLFCKEKLSTLLTIRQKYDTGIVLYSSMAKHLEELTALIPMLDVILHAYQQNRNKSIICYKSHFFCFVFVVCLAFSMKVRKCRARTKENDLFPVATASFTLIFSLKGILFPLVK